MSLTLPLKRLTSSIPLRATRSLQEAPGVRAIHFDQTARPFQPGQVHHLPFDPTNTRAFTWKVPRISRNWICIALGSYLVAMESAGRDEESRREVARMVTLNTANDANDSRSTSASIIF
ncbi:hypothetical protein MPER_07508 [Moniliophthora perniciosa FA553]|nr:hypothetical protein MPER_07508 [Moniliophthora perniciosa FA553]